MARPPTKGEESLAEERPLPNRPQKPARCSYVRSRAVLDGDLTGRCHLTSDSVTATSVRFCEMNPLSVCQCTAGRRANVFAELASYLSQVAGRRLRKRNALRRVRGKSAMRWIPLEVPTFCPQKFTSLSTFTSYDDSGHVEPKASLRVDLSPVSGVGSRSNWDGCWH